MIERRSQLRYMPRLPIQVSVNLGGRRLEGHLGDVSEGGCLVLFPLDAGVKLAGGTRLEGAMQADLLGDRERDWSGQVTHCSPIRCGQGMGIRFESRRKDIVDLLVAAKEAGALRLRRDDRGARMDVVGHLGFSMNRQFLSLVRSGELAAIDLGQCQGIDSAGLGLLSIARQQHIPLDGARGRLETLLQIARLH